MPVAAAVFKIASTGLNRADAGVVAWANPPNVTTDDAANATADLDFESAVTSQWIVGEVNSRAEIEEEAPILGVEARVQGSRTATAELFEAQLWDGSALAGTKKSFADALTATPTNFTYGSATDKWGLTNLSAATVRNGKFGAAFRARVVGLTFPQVLVGAIWLKVHSGSRTPRAMFTQGDRGIF